MKLTKHEERLLLLSDVSIAFGEQAFVHVCQLLSAAGFTVLLDSPDDSKATYRCRLRARGLYAVRFGGSLHEALTFCIQALAR